MDKKQLQKMITDNEVQAIDLKYSGLDGKWYHITFPAGDWILCWSTEFPLMAPAFPA